MNDMALLQEQLANGSVDLTPVIDKMTVLGNAIQEVDDKNPDA